MKTNTKPILHYSETIVNLWPDPIQDAFEHFSQEFQQLPSNHELMAEFDTLIDNVYREGYKDGLELCHWLENGVPQLEL